MAHCGSQIEVRDLHTQKPMVSVNHVSFHYGAVDGHKDILAAFYLLFRILGTAEAQCEFWLSFTAGLQPP